MGENTSLLIASNDDALLELGSRLRYAASPGKSGDNADQRCDHRSHGRHAASSTVLQEGARVHSAAAEIGCEMSFSSAADTPCRDSIHLGDGSAPRPGGSS